MLDIKRCRFSFVYTIVLLLFARRFAFGDTTSVLRSMSLPTRWVLQRTHFLFWFHTLSNVFFFFFMYLSYHTMCVVVWQAIGFSGHHLGIAIDVAAYAMGATWNERHFTKDRTWKGTDHAASLEPTGLTVCIYICISIYLSLSIYICVYIYIYVYIYYDRTWKGTDHAASLEHTGLTVCIYICISISLSLSIYIHICIHIHICLHILWPHLEGNWPRGLARAHRPHGVHIYMYIYLSLSLYIYTYMYTHTYMFTYIMTEPGRELTTRPRWAHRPHGMFRCIYRWG